MCHLLLVSVCLFIHALHALETTTTSFATNQQQNFTASMMPSLKILNKSKTDIHNGTARRRDAGSGNQPPKMHAGVSNAKVYLKSRLLENLNKYSEGASQELELLENTIGASGKFSPEASRTRFSTDQIEQIRAAPQRPSEISPLQPFLSKFEPSLVSPLAPDQVTESSTGFPTLLTTESTTTIPTRAKIFPPKNKRNPVREDVSPTVSSSVAEAIRDFRKKLYKSYRDGKPVKNNNMRQETKTTNEVLEFTDNTPLVVDKNRQVLLSRKEPNWSKMFSETPIYGKDKNGKMVRLFGVEGNGYKAENGVPAISPELLTPGLTTFSRHSPQNRVVYVPAPNLDKNPQYVIPPLHKQNIQYPNSPTVQYSTNPEKKLYFVTATPRPAPNIQYTTNTVIPLLQEFSNTYTNNVYQPAPKSITPYPPESQALTGWNLANFPSSQTNYQNNQNQLFGQQNSQQQASFPIPPSDLSWKPNPSAGGIIQINSQPDFKPNPIAFNSLGQLSNFQGATQNPNFGGATFPPTLITYGNQNFITTRSPNDGYTSGRKGPGGFGKNEGNYDDNNLDLEMEGHIVNDCEQQGNCPLETDDKCNSERLREVILRNIVANDAEISKREVQQAAERETGRYIDVVCGTGFFSYIAHTDEFCLASSGGVNCYAFSPVCPTSDQNFKTKTSKKKFLSRNKV